jgi:gliding motility-associated-like protein
LDTLIINGSGFSASPASLQVWFGPVTGTIVSSTNNLIEVVVPAQATTANVEVLNLTTKLSTKSNAKFAPYFSGNTFDATKLGTPLTFTDPVSELYDLCSCDFSGDGKPDVAVSKFDNAGNVLILKNQSTVGTVSFTQQTANIGFSTEQVSCGDLNGDGKPDLVASRSLNPRHTVFFLQNTSSAGNISFGAASSLFLDPGHYARFIFIRDLNVDGKPEIIVSNSNNNEMYIYLNTSSGGAPTFNPTPIRIAVAGAANLYGLDVQDMNGDSKPELIITQFNKNNIYILINKSTNLIQFDPVPFTQNTVASFNKIIAADFNEDGKTDIVASNFFNSTVDVWYNTAPVGSIQFTKVAITTSSQPNGLDVQDIDGDKDLDILVGHQGSVGMLGVLINDGNANPTFSKVDIARPGVNRNILAVDFDGDAKPDIAHVNRTSTNVFSINFLRNTNCFKPEILNPTPLSICVGQTIQLKSIPGINVTNDWQKSAVSFKNGPDHFADITTSGGYTVTSTGEGGTCFLSTPTFTVNPDAGATVPTEPQITSNQPICTGQTLTLSTPTVSGGTYTWTKPNGTTVTGQNVSIPSTAVTDAGEYSLVVTVGACRSNEAETLVDITNLANFDIYSPSLTNSACQGSSISLTVTSYPNFNYAWLKDGAIIGGQTTTALAAATSGLYKSRVTHASIAGCSVDTREIDVKILTPPVASFTLPSPACLGMSLNFASTSSKDALATPVFGWTFGDTGTSSLETDTHTYTTAQSFPVALTVSYLGVAGCTSTSNQSLVVANAALPVITPSLSEICPGEESVLTVSGGTFTEFNWTPTATGNPLTITEGGDYSVTTKDSNGCTATDTETIVTKPTPVISVSSNTLTTPSGQPVQLQVNVETPVGTETYAWSPIETLSDPTIANPIATTLASATYTVIVSTPGQCDVEGSITITVSGEVKIPNVFTPNGDSNNDTWRIPGSEVMTDCIVSIFDKAGSRILEEFANAVDWDGTYNGKPVPPGTYYFIINCPNSQPITGHILVAR